MWAALPLKWLSHFYSWNKSRKIWGDKSEDASKTKLLCWTKKLRNCALFMCYVIVVDSSLVSQTELVFPQDPGPAPRSSQACGVVCFQPNNEWHGWWAHTKTQQWPNCSATKPTESATQTLINPTLRHASLLLCMVLKSLLFISAFHFILCMEFHPESLFHLLFYLPCSLCLC